MSYVHLLVAIYITAFVAALVTVLLRSEERYSAACIEAQDVRRGGKSALPEKEPSFDHETTIDLAGIYIQVEEMYQKAKREGRKDVQERLAPLLDSVANTWRNQ